MENKIKSYKDLIAWQKAIQLVSDIYVMTRILPAEERYGLTSQINRSVISIPANIAEGWGRESTKSYLQFLRTARGSVMELETLLMISRNLSYINEESYSTLQDRIEEVGRILNGLIISLNNKIKLQETPIG